jgi:peptidoglycan hydrolase CwlO-like protein
MESNEELNKMIMNFDNEIENKKLRQRGITSEIQSKNHEINEINYKINEMNKKLGNLENINCKLNSKKCDLDNVIKIICDNYNINEQE